MIDAKMGMIRATAAMITTVTMHATVSLVTSMDATTKVASRVVMWVVITAAT